jgi:hypothetical protein
MIGFRFPKSSKTLLFALASRPTALSHGINRPKREAHPSAPYSTQFKKAWTYPPLTHAYDDDDDDNNNYYYYYYYPLSK